MLRAAFPLYLARWGDALVTRPNVHVLRFWIADIIGPCMMISVPPMCTQHFFWNVALLPPQYSSFSETNGYPNECPTLDTGAGGEDMGEAPGLYDPVAIAESPISAAAGAPVKLPPAQLREGSLTAAASV